MGVVCRHECQPHPSVVQCGGLSDDAVVQPVVGGGYPRVDLGSAGRVQRQFFSALVKGGAAELSFGDSGPSQRSSRSRADNDLALLDLAAQLRRVVSSGRP